MAAHRSLSHRKDIQGLRALAILAVVAYHAGVPGISGGFVGVDFFFVLSGYLITGLLVHERLTTGAVSLRAFWARRARRLLPASSLALVGTALASVVVLPVLERRSVAVDVVWASLFGANWRFAEQQTDYLAQERSPSPVLHFWSLGVEEQFYVAWPLLVVAVVLVAVRRSATSHQALRIHLAIAFAVVAVTSLAWSVHETAVNQPYAFFGTPARAWQLAVGGLLAVLLPLISPGRRARLALGTIGSGAFAVALVGLREAGVSGMSYPGWLALLPTLAAASLVAAGAGSEPTALGRVLSVRALNKVGDLSYSWYLWHWPALVLLPLALGSQSPLVSAAAVAISFALAWASYTFVEQPVRSARILVRSPGRSLATGAALVAAVAPFAVVLGTVEVSHTVVAVDGNHITLRPPPDQASSDITSMRAVGCDADFEETTVGDCAFGDPDATRSAVLLGDSHAVAAFPGLNEAAKQEGYRLFSWTKSACPVADVTRYDKAHGRVFTECDEFRSAILDRILEARPEVVVIAMYYKSNARLVDRGTGERLPAEAVPRALAVGLRSVIKRLEGTGIRVVLLRDLPKAPFDPPACLASEGRVKTCGFRRPAGPSFEARAVSGLDVELVNLARGVCGPRRCHPVVGDVLVYRDSNHITRTYSLSLRHRFASALRGES